MSDNRLQRNVKVIKQIQEMSEEELDVFMKEFLKGMDKWNFSMKNLAIFMQLLLQMDSKLAERFMMAMADKDEQKND